MSLKKNVLLFQTFQELNIQYKKTKKQIIYIYLQPETIKTETQNIPGLN